VRLAPADARELAALIAAGLCSRAMSSRTSRILSFSSPLAIGLAFALSACGGASSQPAGPAPVVVTPPPAGDGTAPAAPKVTKLGPNVTPEGVVFNFKMEGKPHQIYLAGNFNNWSKDDDAYLLKDDDGDSIWSITVKLAPGTYQYKYVADGKWTQDMEAPGDAPDGYGGRNSQFEVK
jgi:hypothetical protein